MWAFKALNPGDVDLQPKAYGAIYADPAWKYRTRTPEGLGRSADRHYKTMTLEEIMALPVRDLATRDCHLFMWITGPFLAIGAHVPVLKAWGFRPSSIAFVWLKSKKETAQGRIHAPPLDESAFVHGMGQTTKQNAEYVILGRRGSPRRMSKSVRQEIIEPRRQHSRKPDCTRDRIREYVGPDIRCCELFGRTQLEGWDSWGNETGKFPAAA